MVVIGGDKGETPSMENRPAGPPGKSKKAACSPTTRKSSSKGGGGGGGGAVTDWMRYLSNINTKKIHTNIELRSHVQLTTHDDPLVRKDAFQGIKDHVRAAKRRSGDPTQLQDNEHAIYPKLCLGIIDTQDAVREAAYDLLLIMVQLCPDFEKYVPSLFVPSVVEALAHSELGVHLTGRKVYEFLVHRIPSTFNLYLVKIFQSLEDMIKDDEYEQKCSHIHMLRVFQSVNVCLSSMPSMPSADECYNILSDQKYLGLLKSVLSTFPRNWNQHSNIGDSEHFDIDIEVTKIFLRLPKLSDSEKFLAFLNEKLHKITENNLEELLSFYPPYVPMLVSSLGSHSQANLIQAFTAGFKRSRPKSAFKSACVAAIEQMLSGSFVQDVNSELFQMCRREWLEELCKLIPLIGYEKRCTFESSQVVLRTLLTACSSTNFEGLEKHMLTTFCFLFRPWNEGPAAYCGSLFYYIPKDMQEQCLRFLRYFPVVDEHLLRSMAHACVRHNMKCLREIISGLDEYYRSQHEQADDLFLFFFSILVSEIEVYKDNATSTCLRKSATDYMDVILPKLRYDALSQFPPVTNYRSQYALLRVVAEFDVSLAKSSSEFITTLSDFILGYMIEITQFGGDREDEIAAQNHYLSPCFAIMNANTEFFDHILHKIIKYVEAQSCHACLDKMIGVSQLLALMREYVGVTKTMIAWEDKFESMKSSLISFKYLIDDYFESIPIKKYHKLIITLQQLMV